MNFEPQQKRSRNGVKRRTRKGASTSHDLGGLRTAIKQSRYTAVQYGHTASHKHAVFSRKSALRFFDSVWIRQLDAKS